MPSFLVTLFFYIIIITIINTITAVNPFSLSFSIPTQPPTAPTQQGFSKYTPLNRVQTTTTTPPSNLNLKPFVKLYDLTTNTNSTSAYTNAPYRYVHYNASLKLQELLLSSLVTINRQKLLKSRPPANTEDSNRERIERIELNDHLSIVTTLGIDSLLLLEHAPVYTLGTGAQGLANLTPQPSSSSSSIPVIHTRRSGEITYHGPGQLVMYPVLDLRRYKVDLHWYLRCLEETVIASVKNTLGRFGLSDTGDDGGGWEVYRHDNITGVFLKLNQPPSISQQHDDDDDDNDTPIKIKIASIGIKAKSYITMHGISLNVLPSSMVGFGGIKACGLEGVKYGCLFDAIHDSIHSASDDDGSDGDGDGDGGESRIEMPQTNAHRAMSITTSSGVVITEHDLWGVVKDEMISNFERVFEVLLV